MANKIRNKSIYGSIPWEIVDRARPGRPNEKTKSRQVPRISVLLPVDSTTNRAELHRAHTSILEQSTPPDEILLVTNQSLPGDLLTAIKEVVSTDSVSRHEHIPAAAGLGSVLQAGLNRCSGRYVARMDADDVALPERFSEQHAVLTDGGVDIVGTQLTEFRDDPSAPHRTRHVPSTHKEIADNMRFRCPLNHPTTMFDRESVLAVGGYREFPMMEDWELWARCLASGLRFRNLERSLVRAHVDELAARRGGMDYVRAEIRMARELRRLGIASRRDTLSHLSLRLPPRVLPARLRELVYSWFAR